MVNTGYGYRACTSFLNGFTIIASLYRVVDADHLRLLVRAHITGRSFNVNEEPTSRERVFVDQATATRRQDLTITVMQSWQHQIYFRSFSNCLYRFAVNVSSPIMRHNDGYSLLCPKSGSRHVLNDGDFGHQFVVEGDFIAAGYRPKSGFAGRLVLLQKQDTLLQVLAWTWCYRCHEPTLDQVEMGLAGGQLAYLDAAKTMHVLPLSSILNSTARRAVNWFSYAALDSTPEPARARNTTFGDVDWDIPTPATSTSAPTTTTTTPSVTTAIPLSTIATSTTAATSTKAPPRPQQRKKTSLSVVQQAMASTVTLLVLALIAVLIRRRRSRKVELYNLFEEVSTADPRAPCGGCNVVLPLLESAERRV